MTATRLLRGLATALAVVGLSGCGGDGSDALLVLTASSLTPAATAYATDSDPTATVSDAGSQLLVAQLRGGAPADVILLADPDLAAELERDGLAGPPTTLPGTRLSLLTRGPVDIASLVERGTRLVLADATVPLGRYTRTALADLEASGALPAGGADALVVAAVSLEDAARSVAAKVRSGDADAAIVYRTDALLAAATDDRLVVTDLDVAPMAPYTAQVVTTTGDAEAAAAWISGLVAAPVWDELGFTPS